MPYLNLSTIMRPKYFYPLLVLSIFVTLFAVNNYFFQIVNNDDNGDGGTAVERSLNDIVNSVTAEDLIAMVFWEKDDAATLCNGIMEEKRKGIRDEEN